MTFLKRRFGSNETPVDLRALGIEQRRVPRESWDWAVDDERSVWFTQLRSDTAEMREGDYWYALVIDDFAAVLHVEASTEKRIDGRVHLKARFQRLPSSLPIDGLSHLQTLAREAMTVISIASEALDFNNDGR